MQSFPAFITMVAAVSAALCGCAPSIAGAPNLSEYNLVTKRYFQDGYSASELETYRTAADPFVKKSSRNSIILSAIGLIDIQYSKFAGELTRESQGVPFIATLTSLSLSGAGTLVGSSAAKTTLAAVDTGIKGARAAYDTNILSEKTIQFLQKQMQANRNQVKSSIVSKLSLDTGSYPLELAMIDVNDYAAAGTVAAGLIGIDAQTSQALTETEEEKVETIYTYGADEATVAIRAYFDTGDPAVIKAIDDASGKTTLPRFLNDAQYAESRRKLLAALRKLKPG